MKAKLYRAEGSGEMIHHAITPCSLGLVLIACSRRGMCAILIGDEPQNLQQDLTAWFPKADHVPADASFQKMVGQVVGLIDHPSAEADTSLPLDLHGTVFQCRVWDDLRKISFQKTNSYEELAEKIGTENRFSAVAPYHQFIAESGKKSGHR